ncbi:ATP-binding protein [Ferruginivarius sediminum]|uniref:histidine kinase n=1 Tax=Ferruginivarius sediminum TaxID=2661937 RepID=A0A369T5X8_9PROT|nr:ATP-binding protein [Ferruginivarius sediminum]RDD60312.1 histidine kinase [Ferruginivarius sediminum]
MKSPAIPAKRSYKSWIANETLEDYSLRYAARSFRRWSGFSISNTALGGISFLALEAIGGAITLNYGFINAFPAILVVCLCVFVTSLPIAYYSSRYNIDMDLLTRGAGFGYIGSTITSLIYASFTFIFFALEAAIMAQALKIYADVPLVFGYVISSMVIIPITFMGVTMISRLQIITQPIWGLMLVLPFVFIFYEQPHVLQDWVAFARPGEQPGFNYLFFGAATGVLFSLVVQIGEQVDYLRFLPDKTAENRLRWWTAVVAAGPGWIVIGGLKILAGSLLAVLAVGAGTAHTNAVEPIHMYIKAYEYVSDDPSIVLAAATFFVLISQIKINVTNAYAGSLAWSNFFSRATHYHPGRVVWLVFNILISLLLMLLGIFETLEVVLAVYSNVAIAWIGAVFADLVVLKPLRVSPSYVEFKRAHLYNINPVGCGAMAIASVVSVSAFAGLFGPLAEAYSAPLSFFIAFAVAILVGFATKGGYYIAREPHPAEGSAGEDPDRTVRCRICSYPYESDDMAHCPFYEGPICSLCCSLDSHCHDSCKKPVADLLQKKSRYVGRYFTRKVAPHMGQRLAKFLGVLLILSVVTAALFLLVYRMIDVGTGVDDVGHASLLLRVYIAMIPLLCIAAWWVVLSHESWELAERDLVSSLEQLHKTRHELARNERLATIGELTGTVSHELRNPLGTLTTSVSVLTHHLKRADTPVRQELERMQRNVRRCTHIIEELLEFSRKRENTLRTVAVDDWVARQVDEFDTHEDVRLRMELDCEVEILVDADKLRQAFVNVLQNAVQAVQGADGREAADWDVLVRTWACDTSVAIAVSDNGPGMGGDVRKQVFEPLYSAKPFGVGLGMPLVKRIVEQHEGNIELESAPGRGTTVTMILPRWSSALGERALSAASDRESVPRTKPGSKAL